MRIVVLASSNRGKQREFAALLAASGIELRCQTDFNIGSIEETGATFAANALLKARHASEHSGFAALADDSGLEVDALGGRPGVYSARFAGPQATDEQNNTRLLAELAQLPDAARSARYRCVLAFVRRADDPAPLLASGSWEGRVAQVPAGGGGFGYDPLFIPSGCSQTAAQLPPEQKNALSHRGAALRALVAQLDQSSL